MPSSMTGFASQEVRVGDFDLTWEIRSVNHRYLDVSFRLPEELRRLEPVFRQAVSTALGRGKVDCTLRLLVSGPSSSNWTVNEDALALLGDMEKKVRADFPEARPLTSAEILRWPGIMEEAPSELGILEQPAKDCLDEALSNLKSSRAREGERIGEALEQRCARIEEILGTLRPLLGRAETRYRAKLIERLDRVDITADPERLEQELVLLAQRLDVSEELDRLSSHIAEIGGVLQRSEPIGRRMDFLIQELNREANTLTSKAQDEELTRSAVELKVLIEQMREQVQNLE